MELDPLNCKKAISTFDEDSSKMQTAIYQLLHQIIQKNREQKERGIQ